MEKLALHRRINRKFKISKKKVESWLHGKVKQQQPERKCVWILDSMQKAFSYRANIFTKFIAIIRGLKCTPSEINVAIENAMRY
jgi:hypothetical protein